jgi:hypothetical protein
MPDMENIHNHHSKSYVDLYYNDVYCLQETLKRIKKVSKKKESSVGVKPVMFDPIAEAIRTCY